MFEAEPETWQSDISCDLVSTGMKHCLGDLIRIGYQCAKKPGRPLLFYAFNSGVSSYDGLPPPPYRLDWTIVEFLLEHGCDPNEMWFDCYESYTCLIDDVRGSPWHTALGAAYFCLRRSPPCKRLETQTKKEWLMVLKTLIRHGANVKASLRIPWSGDLYDGNILKGTPLEVFDMTFQSDAGNLVSEVRHMMIASGATGQIPDATTERPFVRPEITLDPAQDTSATGPRKYRLGWLRKFGHKVPR